MAQSLSNQKGWLLKHWGKTQGTQGTLCCARDFIPVIPWWEVSESLSWVCPVTAAAPGIFWASKSCFYFKVWMYVSNLGTYMATTMFTGWVSALLLMPTSSSLYQSLHSLSVSLSLVVSRCKHLKAMQAQWHVITKWNYKSYKNVRFHEISVSNGGKLH